MKVKIAGALALVTALTAAWLAAHGYQTFAEPYCSSGATNVSSAVQLVDAVEEDRDVCVTSVLAAEVFLLNAGPDEITGTGDVSQGSATITNVAGDFEVGMRLEGDGLDYEGHATGKTRITAVNGATLTIAPVASGTAVGSELRGADDIEIGSSGDGYIPHVEIDGGSWLTVHARMKSIRVDEAEDVLVNNSVIGGTENNPAFTSSLVFMPSTSEDVVLSNNDIGFTTNCTVPEDPGTCDQGGNVGFGVRVYGDNNRLHITGNRIHHIAADGMQGFGGEDVLVDRNEIGPVGPNEGSEEHSDVIQLTGNGPNMRITNNWFHHQGYYGEAISGNAGNIYVHGGLPDEEDLLTIENNLFEHSRGRFEACGLGFPDDPYFRKNVVIRNNTVRDQGQAYEGFPGFEWDCSDPASADNLIERNIFVDPDGGLEDHGITAGVTFADNLVGTEDLVTFDEDGNCTSSNCNPEGDPVIGYRKPTGVVW